MWLGVGNMFSGQEASFGDLEEKAKPCKVANTGVSTGWEATP